MIVQRHLRISSPYSNRKDVTSRPYIRHPRRVSETVQQINESSVKVLNLLLSTHAKYPLIEIVNSYGLNVLSRLRSAGDAVPVYPIARLLRPVCVGKADLHPRILRLQLLQCSLEHPIILPSEISGRSSRRIFPLVIAKSRADVSIARMDSFSVRSRVFVARSFALNFRKSCIWT